MKKSLIGFCTMVFAVIALTFASCGETAPAADETETIETVEPEVIEEPAIKPAMDSTAVETAPEESEATEEETTEEGTEGGK